MPPVPEEEQEANGQRRGELDPIGLNGLAVKVEKSAGRWTMSPKLCGLGNEPQVMRSETSQSEILSVRRVMCFQRQ